MKDLFLYLKLYPRLFNYSIIKTGLSYLWHKHTTFPLTINFLITSKCNFKCKMCSFYGGGQPQSSDLSGYEIIKFIKSISDYKPIIHIGGGEPFVRKDIYEIISEIKNQDLTLVITTNGYLLNPDKVKKFGIDYIIFSLYGPPDIHNAITGVPDAYEKVIKNIEVLPKENVVVSTTIMPDNINYLEQLIQDIVTRGVRRIKIENLNYITPEEYKTHPFQIDDYILKPTTFITSDLCKEEVKEIWKVIENLRAKYKDKIFLKPNLNKKQFLAWYSGLRRKTYCRFITHSVFIDNDGSIIPCQFLKNCKLGNITSDELKYIWNAQKFERLRRLINTLNLAICRRCCK